MNHDRQMLRYLRLRVFWLVCIALLLPGLGFAHEIRPAVADLAFDESRVSVTFRINIEAILAQIGPEHDDTDNSPGAEYYNKLRKMGPVELESIFKEYFNTFLDNLSMRDKDGKAVTPKLADVAIPAIGDIQIARDSLVTLRATLPDDVQALSIAWASQYGALIVRAGKESDNSLFNQYLLPGETSDMIPVSDGVAQSWWSTVKNYFVVGFIHIVPKGLDHILFVIGLFLLSPYWRAIVLQVSAFTIAHTITLALGMTGVLHISASIVEPLIALSIAVVCLENIFTTTLKRWRLAVVIVFGLLHGLGFAGVLSEIGFSSGLFFASLISFNLGVEVGQLLVILVCFLLAGWPFRIKSWYRARLSVPASVLLSTVGMVWFFQRIAN